MSQVCTEFFFPLTEARIITIETNLTSIVHHFNLGSPPPQCTTVAFTRYQRRWNRRLPLLSHRHSRNLETYFCNIFLLKFGLNFQPFFRPLRPKSAVSHKILILYKLTAVVVGIVEMKYEPSSESNPRFHYSFCFQDWITAFDMSLSTLEHICHIYVIYTGWFF